MGSEGRLREFLGKSWDNPGSEPRGGILRQWRWSGGRWGGGRSSYRLAGCSSKTKSKSGKSGTLFLF